MPDAVHVIGSDLLKGQLARYGLESMEGLEEVVKDVIRQFASEEMLRMASECRGIFICEGHAALLPSKPLSRAEKLWRRIQVWAGKRESIYDVSVGFTELDKAFFNEVILVEADPEVILERRLLDRHKLRPTELDAVVADIEAERSKASEICRESGAALRVVDANIPTLALQTLRGLLQASDCTIETAPMYHQRRIRDVASKLGNVATPMPVFLFDADNTLGPYDASQLILKHVGNGLYKRMKDNFKRGYSHYSFLMHHHIHNRADKGRFDGLVQELGRLICKAGFYPGVVDCLREALTRGKVVVLTAGIPEVWRVALRSQGLPVFPDSDNGIMVHGLVDGAENSLVMDEQGKETFAKTLKSMGYYVVSVGDSQIDTGMLRAADAAFFVSREHSVIQDDLGKLTDFKKLQPRIFKLVKNERLLLLLSKHPRIYQVPSMGPHVVVGGPPVCEFRDIVGRALAKEYDGTRADEFADYMPRAIRWLEEYAVEARKAKENKHAK
jgi:phosphoserine phosphatase